MFLGPTRGSACTDRQYDTQHEFTAFWLLVRRGNSCLLLCCCLCKRVNWMLSQGPLFVQRLYLIFHCRFPFIVCHVILFSLWCYCCMEEDFIFFPPRIIGQFFLPALELVRLWMHHVLGSTQGNSVLKIIAPYTEQLHWRISRCCLSTTAGSWLVSSCSFEFSVREEQSLFLTMTASWRS